MAVKYLDIQGRKQIAKIYGAEARVLDIAYKIGCPPATIYEELRQGDTGKLDSNQRPEYDPRLTQRVFQEATFAVTVGMPLDRCPFENKDADREDHNNFSGSYIQKVMKRFWCDKHSDICLPGSDEYVPVGNPSGRLLSDTLPHRLQERTFYNGPGRQERQATFASHSHTLKNSYKTSTDETSEYHYGLAVGGKVILLQNQGGQAFFDLRMVCPKGHLK